ncbi:HNH endonuclease [Nocardia sp. CA-128927]|uniref:HNH endonuclease n=1 Tax=Nocardia sp. CA-128927 TaxID=3239975 RepID=UPI003D991A31
MSALHRKNRPLVLERDGYICQLRYPDCTVRAVEADHVINYARGGSDDVENLQAACSSCHKVKTNAESVEARAALKRAARHPDSLRKHPGLR